MLAQIPDGDWIEADLVYGVHVAEDPQQGWVVRATDDCGGCLLSESFEQEQTARDYALSVAISVNACKSKEPDVEAIIRDAVKAAVEAMEPKPRDIRGDGPPPPRDDVVSFGDWRHAV
jgi:hypothetical protein